MPEAISTPAAPEAAPSPAPETAVPSTGVTATSPAQPATTAPSPSAPSPPTEGENRESLLKAVQQAVPELRTSQTDKAQPDDAPIPASTATSETPPDDYSDLPDDPTPEELARSSASAKARITKLAKQRQELRAQVQEQAAQLERFQSSAPQIEAAESVQKYLADNDIGREDFLLTLELAAAMRRGDFRAFYEGVRPYVQLAEEYLGIRLPADLQQQVQQGHMTTQAAAAFSRERMDRALSETQRVRAAERYDTQTQDATRQMLASSVRDHVNAWEQAVARVDPDYAAIKPLLHDVMWSVVRERGAPQSPDQAVAIAKEAYSRVKTHAKTFVPPARATQRTPSSTGRTSGAAPDPKNLTDVVVQALERARA